MSYYDKNLHQVRYYFAEKKPGTGKAPSCFFYIGIALLKEACFEIGDSLILIEEGKKSFIIEKNVFGSTLCSYNLKVGGNYARIHFKEKIMKHFKFPRSKDILVLEHEVFTHENPANNYILVKF